MKLSKAIIIMAMSISPVFSKTPLKFETLGNANWQQSNEVYYANSGQGFLVSKNEFQNVYIKVEFQAGHGTNSGLFFRCQDEQNINDQSCYEANIFDTRQDQKYRTGGVTGYTSPKVIINTEDKQWHKYEIYAVEDKIRVLLDGKETVYMRNQKHHKGKVALQFSQGEIKFRKIIIKEIQVDTLNAKPSQIDGVWELEAMYTVNNQGDIFPWCEGAFGVIIYTEGYMSTAVNCTSNPKRSVLYAGPIRFKDQTVYHYAQNYQNSELHKVFSRNYKLIDKNHLELSGDLGDSKVIVKWVRR